MNESDYKAYKSPCFKNNGKALRKVKPPFFSANSVESAVVYSKNNEIKNTLRDVFRLQNIYDVCQNLWKHLL